MVWARWMEGDPRAERDGGGREGGSELGREGEEGGRRRRHRSVYLRSGRRRRRREGTSLSLSLQQHHHLHHHSHHHHYYHYHYHRHYHHHHHYCHYLCERACLLPSPPLPSAPKKGTSQSASTGHPSQHEAKHLYAGTGAITICKLV